MLITVSFHGALEKELAADQRVDIFSSQTEQPQWANNVE